MGKSKKKKKENQQTSYEKSKQVGFDTVEQKVTNIRDNMTEGEKKTYQKVVDAIQNSTAIVPLKKGTGKSQETTQVKFNHAQSCLCSDCGRAGGIPALDHGPNCVCYKCKDKKSGSKGLSGSTTSYSYSPCHEGNVFVFKHQGISVYGGGNLKDPEPNKVDIVLDLDRNVRSVSWENDLPKDWQCRNRSSSKTKVLDLFIKDMHAPEHVDAGFWKLFWADLRKEAHNNGGKLSILVMCQGGHGRTGVVLASLIMASAYNNVGIPKDVHVVKWLREKYCDKAVESQRQCEYLTRLWDMRFIIPTKGIGSTSSFSKGATTGSNSGKADDPPFDDEIPTANTQCATCQTKRKAGNRVLFSGDLEEFECDICFGKRADKLEAEEEADIDDILKLEDSRTDLTEECDGSSCFDQYDEQMEIWTTLHTYQNGCESIPEKGEDLEGIPINDMTDEQYAIWSASLLS